jgi:hypothetical protein
VASTTIVDGHLVVRYTDGTSQDVGQVVGATGDAGATGPAGRGISTTVITNGHLVLIFSDGATTDVGPVVGPVGTSGPSGAAGRGVASATINSASHLIVTYTDGTSADAGPVPPGPPGPVGAQGAQGAQGVGVTDVRFEEDSSGTCQAVITLHDPATGTDSTVTHPAGAAACPVAAPAAGTATTIPLVHHTPRH